MNFSAYEYWTDGWREGSLMPNDQGLRRCNCGRYVLVKNLIEVETAESSDLPRMDHVPEEQLPDCIAHADAGDLEVAARLGYWHFLNHPYRELYRQHRDAEEAATEAAWVAANPDRRTWWDKFKGQKAPSYSRPAGSPFTQPVFDPTAEQRENMLRLSELLLAWDAAAPRPRYPLERAELYRELGRFDEAEKLLQTLGQSWVGVTSQLIGTLSKQRQSAPMRYMM